MLHIDARNANKGSATTCARVCFRFTCQISSFLCSFILRIEILEGFAAFPSGPLGPETSSKKCGFEATEHYQTQLWTGVDPFRASDLDNRFLEYEKFILFTCNFIGQNPSIQ